MNLVNTIKHEVLTLGACAKVRHIRTLNDAISMLFTPQGREFAMRTGYPSLDLWRENASQVRETIDVFLDSGNAEVEGCDFIAVGNCNINARYSRPNQLYHIIVMHGASVTVYADNYAVITLTDIGGNIRVINDGTAKINIEQ